MAATKVASAYIDLSVQYKGAMDDITRSLTGVQQEAKRAGDRAGGFLGRAMSVAAGNVIFKGASKITGALNSAMQAGFDRRKMIDAAEFKLKGLGHAADEVTTIMKDANASVLGTAFGLEEAATTAASAVAAGIKPGQELEKYLTLVGDAAAQTGHSMDGMGRIFNKVQSMGKLTGMELQQLAQLPVGQWLADELGVAGDEVFKLVSKGQVSADLFREVVAKNIGGAAQEMGGSFEGAMKNMRASMNRFGEQITMPMFEAAQPLALAVTKVFNTLTKSIAGPMDNISRIAGEWAKSMGERLIAWTEGPGLQKVLDWFARLGDAMSSGNMSHAVSGLLDAFKQMGPALASAGGSFVTIGQTLAQIGPEVLTAVLVPALKVLAEVLKFVSDNATWAVPALVGIKAVFLIAGPAAKVFAVGLTAVKVALTVLTGAFKGVMIAFRLLSMAFMANPIGVIIAVVVALGVALWAFFTKTETGRKIWDKVWNGIKAVVSAVWEWLQVVFEGLVTAFKWVGERAVEFWQGAIVPVWEGIKEAFSTAWDFIKGIFDKLKAGFSATGDFIKTVANSIRDGVRAAFAGLVDVMKKPLHMIGRLLQGLPDKIGPIPIPGVGQLKSWGNTLAGLNEGGTVGSGGAGRTSSGALFGPGTGTSDSILAVTGDGVPIARVSHGEGIVKESVMRRGGAAIVEALNGGQFLKALPGFDQGGALPGGRRRKPTKAQQRWLNAMQRGFDPTAELPRGLAPEGGLQRNTIRGSRIISTLFPELQQIGGYRQDALKWHPNGLALDVMIPGAGSKDGKALGNEINKFIKDNPGLFQSDYTMWQEPDHYDHVHANFAPSGMPGKDEQFFLPQDMQTKLLKLAEKHGLDSASTEGLLGGMAGIGGTGLSGGAFAPVPVNLEDVAAGTGTDKGRTEGLIPAAAAGGGKAGSSFMAGVVGMGGEVVKGLIDQGVSMASTAASLAVAGGTMGAGAPAAPAAGAATAAALGIGADAAKRGVDWATDLMGIGIDSAAEIFSPFGISRFFQTDPMQFAPQLPNQATGTTTAEQGGGQGATGAGQARQSGPGQNITGFGQDGQGMSVAAFGGFDMGDIISQATDGDVSPVTTTTSGQHGQGLGARPGPSVQAAFIDPLRNAKVYDQGGILPPGGVAVNKSRRPEPMAVFTGEQWKTLAGLAENGRPRQGMRPVNQTGNDYSVRVDSVTVKDVEELERELGSRQRLQMMRHAGRP